MFTGDLRKAENESYNGLYERLRNHTDNFRVDTLEGVDADDEDDGIRLDDEVTELPSWISKDSVHKYNGYKYKDLPQAFIIGDSTTYAQSLNTTDVFLP